MKEIKSLDGKHVIAHYWYQEENPRWIEFESSYPKYFNYSMHPDDAENEIRLIQEDFDHWQSTIQDQILVFRNSLEAWL